MTGITSMGVYVPRLRMERAAIAKAHSWMTAKSGGAKGFKSFPSWDEDAITMAVEASRPIVEDREAVQALYLASTTVPFADLQNSAIVCDALRLSGRIKSLDAGGSRRCATSALITALELQQTAIVVASDAPVGKPASTQEMAFGAGAVAIRLGQEGVIAECLSNVSRSEFFVDSFRSATEQFDYGWEERWIRDEGYLRLIPDCARAALQAAGVEPGAVAHFILPSAQSGVAAAVAKKLGIPAQACAPTQSDTIGFAGAAAPFLALAEVLERAEPGQVILLLGFGQGVDAVVLKTTALLSAERAQIGFRKALEDRIDDSSYLRMLSFQGNIELEWGMRAEKEVKTALTEQYRSLPQLGAFNAGKCGKCGTIQFPQLSYCVNPSCNAAAVGFTDVSLVDEPAELFTFTADWLSYHAAPPLYVGFVQFANGARVLMEIVDVGPNGLAAGVALKMVYRVKDHDKLRNYKRYFWKATPISVAPRGSGQ